MTNPGEFTNLCVFGDTLCVCVRANTLSTGNPPIGATCPPASETQDCQDVPCPIDCAGDYAPWGECSASCGGGTQTSEFIATQATLYGGAECPATKTQACNEDVSCPIDCVGAYEDGPCSGMCAGTMTSTYVVSQEPLFGGQA